jgi:hypothetical protein
MDIARAVGRRERLLKVCTLSLPTENFHEPDSSRSSRSSVDGAICKLWLDPARKTQCVASAAVAFASRRPWRVSTRTRCWCVRVIVLAAKGKAFAPDRLIITAPGLATAGSIVGTGRVASGEAPAASSTTTFATYQQRPLLRQHEQTGNSRRARLHAIGAGMGPDSRPATCGSPPHDARFSVRETRIAMVAISARCQRLPADRRRRGARMDLQTGGTTPRNRRVRAIAERVVYRT